MTLSQIEDPLSAVKGSAQGLKLTKSAQLRMCGNSVCPSMVKALILANFAHERQIAGRAA